MKNGYAYRFTGAGPWKSSADDAWEVVLASNLPRATFAGFRTIDGTRCTVWTVPRKGVAPAIYAQSEVHSPAPKGLR